MRPITLVSQLCLLVLPASVYAQSCLTSTERSCSTKMAKVPNWWPVRTSVKTRTAPVVTLTDGALVTVTSTTTVPAAPLTATISTTVVVTSTTTAKAVTNTVSSTSTVFSTVSVVTTNTRTGTVTSTVLATVSNIQTSVIPAPSDFMDAYNSSGDSTYVGSKRSIGRRRDLAARHGKSNTKFFHDFLGAFFQQRKSRRQALSLDDFNNPVAVTCTVTVEKTCGGGSRATTVVVTSTRAPTTTTSITTSTITSVSTRIPPATTITVFSQTITSTITQSTTVAVGATSTTILTSTVTSTSTTSVYAACATANLLGSLIQSGNAISKVYMYDASAVVVTSSESSAYDCCVACQTSTSCQFFQYSGSRGTCFVTGQNADWCPNGQQDAGWPASFVWDDPGKVDDALVVGNGPCGIVMDLGQDQGS